MQAVSFQVAPPKLHDKILLGTWTYAKRVPRRLSLSLNENLRAKEGGKEETGEAHFSFTWSLVLRHRSLGFALPSAPEEEPVPRD